jgi:chitinase
MNPFKKTFFFLATMMVCAVYILSPLRAAPSQPVILGYYSSWGAKYLPPQKVQYKYFNYLTQAFLTTDAQGKMSHDAEFDNQQFVTSAHQNGTKVLLSLGGSSNGKAFGEMAASDAARRRFLNEVLAFAKQYDYDGVDIDWEFPEKGQEALLVQFVKELHDALHAWRKDAVITIAVPAHYWSVPYSAAPQLIPYIDYWNIMTYDFHGPWSSHAGLLSALFPTASDPVDGNKTNLQYSLNYWLQRGVPKDHILMGIPCYGRGFATKAWGTKTDEKPLHEELAYRQILPLLDAGWIKHWDNEAKVPWLELPGTDQRITYEDPQSVQLKAQWAKEQGVAGIFFWEISQDYLNGDNYLVRAAWKAINKEQ